MSIVGVRNIPANWTLKNTSKKLVDVVRGHFQAICFEFPAGVPRKTFYMRLSESLDPLEVVSNINNYKYGHVKNLHAFIPRKLPGSTVGKVNLSKSLSRHNNESERKASILKGSFRMLFLEIYHKYPNLKKIPGRDAFKFLDKIAQKLSDRLISMVLVDSNICDTHYYLTKLYRKVFLHHTDFEFIKECVVELDAELGNIKPTVITEKELSMITDTDFNSLQNAEIYGGYDRFMDPVIKELKEHIDALDSEPSPMDTDEEAAQKKVRAELKNVNIHLEYIVDQVKEKIILKGYKPCKVNIYGEPYLPPLSEVLPVFKQIVIKNVFRSNTMYNLLRIHIIKDHLNDVLKLDGTSIGIVKLSVRSFRYMDYVTPDSIMTKLRNTVIKQ